MVPGNIKLTHFSRDGNNSVTNGGTAVSPDKSASTKNVSNTYFYFQVLTGFNFDVTFVRAHYLKNLRAMMKTLLTKSESRTAAATAVRTVYASKKHKNLPDDEEDYEEMDTYYSSDDDDDTDSSSSDGAEPKLENLDDLDDDDDYYDDDDDY